MGFLVTGSSGCIGAWAVASLHRLGVPVVAADIADDHRRLRYLLSDAEIEGVRFEPCDVTDLESVTRVISRTGITNIVHLAGLQVPFCRADPVLGAQVNVVGTAIVLEAARRQDGKIAGISYASSLAVYGRTGAISAGPGRRPLASCSCDLVWHLQAGRRGNRRPLFRRLRRRDRWGSGPRSSTARAATRVSLRTRPKRCWP